MESNRLSYLFTQLESNSLTTEEREELYTLLRSFDNNDEILAWLEDCYKNTIPQPVDTGKWRPIMESIIATPASPRGVTVSFDRRSRSGSRVIRMWRWVAAACIIALVSVLANVYLRRSTVEGPQTAVSHDVSAPKETRAVITLADGTKVYLDSVSKGNIAQQNNIAVVKNSEGGIQYLSPAGEPVPQQRQGGAKAPGVDYNTLFNPRGSKVISLTLSDGTKVWLNSESSLKYPTAFTSSTREVEITGEAYFEVKHSARQPFEVHLTNGSVVEDIGTAFNVNAYTDEADTKTTLIEGSVKVYPSSRLSALAVKLKPRQQAVYNAKSQQLTANSSVDLDEVLAWKNGLFSFDNANIESVMKQIARWYDVDVVYESKPTKIFRGNIPRDMSAAKVFKALEETGGVHFKIEGRKIIVKQ